MKRSKATGWQQVYQFTFIQTIKSKSIRIMTLLLCTAALLSMPIMQFISSSTEDNIVESRIKTVYVVDESGLGETDYSSVSVMNEMYKDITFVIPDKSLEEITEDIKNIDNGSILLHIIAEQSTYHLEFVKSPDGKVIDTDLNTLSVFVLECFNQNRIKTLGITEEQMALISAPVITEVVPTSVGNVEATEGGIPTEDTKVMSLNEYYLVLVFIVVAVMFLAFGGESVASSIITEKSTRVIEFLMTSIRPLAIIIGKVLAMLTITLLQFVLLGICFVISSFIKQAIAPNEEVLPEMLKGVFTPELLDNLTPINVILTILIFICGFVFFALIAGLTGATVSKIEELAEGIMLFNGFLIIGAYIGMAVCIMNISGNEGGVLAYIAYLLPISSLFVTPAYLFLGRITVIWGLASLLVLILSLVGLALFTAKVYEALILHQGNRLKFKDLISITKEAKREGR